MTGIEVAIAAATLLIGGTSLALLVAQEVRRRRDLPRVSLEIGKRGELSLDGKPWTILEIVNSGSATASNIHHWFKGVTVETTGDFSDFPSVQLNLPSILKPGESARFPVRVEDMDGAWVRLVCTNVTRRRLEVSWEPIVATGAAGAAWSAQVDDKRGQRIPVLGHWPNRLMARIRRQPIAPVGPHVGGRPSACISVTAKSDPGKLMKQATSEELPLYEGVAPL